MSDSQAAEAPKKKELFMDVWLRMLVFAGFISAQRPQFRGLPPRMMSPRQFARSRGYSNAAHMVRAEEEAKRAVQAAGGVVPL